MGKDFGLSDEDFNVNCLAYALGDHHNWWEPPRGQGNYWPDGFSNDISIHTVESIIKLHGYTVESEPTATPETESIAIYRERGEWTHFARFSDGKWSSKLGWSHDVENHELADLEIPIYAKCVKILSRPKT